MAKKKYVLVKLDIDSVIGGALEFGMTPEEAYDFMNSFVYEVTLEQCRKIECERTGDEYNEEDYDDSEE